MSDDIDRAWPRRGLVNQPHFGRTLPSIWATETVVFSRPGGSTGRVPNGKGGFTSIGGDMEYLTVTERAHVRLVEERIKSDLSDDQIISARRLDIRIPYPPSESLIPRKGDLVTWQDARTGVAERMYVRDVTAPRGFRDHIHVVASEQK